jgi:FtsH-binding integral membrane protein
MRENKHNLYRKIFKILIWVLVVASLGTFWVSLRSEEFAMEYAMIAMVLWMFALGLNYLLKKKN